MDIEEKGQDADIKHHSLQHLAWGQPCMLATVLIQEKQHVGIFFHIHLTKMFFTLCSLQRCWKDFTKICFTISINKVITTVKLKKYF